VDPNANLREQRRLAAEIVAFLDSDGMADDETLQRLANELAEHVQALDQWLTGGGFAPRAWQRKPVETA
jgi:hypothetical protein